MNAPQSREALPLRDNFPERPIRLSKAEMETLKLKDEAPTLVANFMAKFPTKISYGATPRRSVPHRRKSPVPA